MHRLVIVLAAAVFGIALAPALSTSFVLNLGYLSLLHKPPDFASTENLFANAETLSPQSARAAEAQGVLALEQGDARAASVSLLRALQWGRAGDLTHWRLAEAFERMGASDQALAQWRAANAAPYFVNQGLARRHLKDWSGAELFLLRAAAIDPRNAAIAHTLGVFYWEWGKFDAARKQLLAAQHLETEPYEATLVRGELAQLNGDFKNATDRYREAIALLPTRPEAYQHLSDVLGDGGETEQAIMLLKQAVARAKPAYSLRLKLAHLLMSGANYDEARQVLEQAQNEDVNSDEAWILAAQLELAQADPVRALVALQNASRREPQNAELYYWQGRAFAQLGQCEEARRAYFKATELAPDDVRFDAAHRVWAGCAG